MTHKDIYEKFMIEYDKANITSSYPSLTEYEVATLLDKAYLALIAQKITGNNPRKVGFESDVKAIEDIRPLVTYVRLEPDAGEEHANNEFVYYLPDNMLYYVSAQEEAEGYLRAVKLVDHETALKFKHTEYNQPWVKNPVAYMEVDDIHVLVDYSEHMEYDHRFLEVTYIRKPLHMFLVDKPKIKVSCKSDNYSLGYTKIDDKLDIVKEVEEGTTVKFEAIPRSGCEFECWNDGDTNAIRLIQIEREIELIAQFSKIEGDDPQPTPTKYEINVLSTDGGIVSGSGNYLYGQIVTIKAVANEGYVFEKWDDGDTNAIRNIVVTENKTYIALFKYSSESQQSSIRVYSNNVKYGTVSGGGSYVNGIDATLIATPNVFDEEDGELYDFIHWEDENTKEVLSTEKEYVFTVTRNRTIIGIFSTPREKFQIHTESNNGQFGYTKIIFPQYEDAVSSDWFSAGSNCTIKAYPHEGYKFVKWSLDGDIDGTQDSFEEEREIINIQDNMMFIATFEKIHENEELPPKTIKLYWGQFDGYKKVYAERSADLMNTYNINTDSQLILTIYLSETDKDGVDVLLNVSFRQHQIIADNREFDIDSNVQILGCAVHVSPWKSSSTAAQILDLNVVINNNNPDGSDPTNPVLRQYFVKFWKYSEKSLSYSSAEHNWYNAGDEILFTFRKPYSAYKPHAVILCDGISTSRDLDMDKLLYDDKTGIYSFTSELTRNMDVIIYSHT